jgi:hypothetical protein
MKGKKKSMLCFIPMLQCESFSHLENCYFCLNKNFIVFEEEQIKTEYYTIPFALKLVSYAEDLPVSVPPTNWKELSIFEE